MSKVESKKKLLILNGSHSDIPLIEAGKKLGFHVITTGNLSELIGHSYADEYHCADFSNLEEILQLSRKLQIDYICSCANDFGAITASYVAEKLSLPGHDSYENTLIIHHKDLFKEFSIKNDIPTPYAKGFNNINAALSAIDDFSLPLIIKPIDLTGGKGITKVVAWDEYNAAIKKAFSMSPQARIVVEEFVNGTQHSFSTFIQDGKVAFYFSDNEHSYLNPYIVSTSAAPAIDIDSVSKCLLDASNKIVKQLSLVDGVFHIQYLYEDGKASIIEITRRCSGDFYPYPVCKSTGIDWAEWIVKAETGFDCSDFPEVRQSGFCGRHCIMAPHDGRIRDIVFSDEIKDNIYDSVLWWNHGDEVSNYLVQKLGILFLNFQSIEEMNDKTARITELVKVVLD